MAPRQSQLLDWLNNTTHFNLNTLEKVSGDASFRHYYRFNVDGYSYIAVDAPPETENTDGFVSIAKAYHKSNVRVPNVLYADVSLGFMCLEDFGNTLLGEVIDHSNYQRYYQKALRQLVNVQSVGVVEEKSLPSYDIALLDRDFGLFTEWLLSTHLNITLSKQEALMLKQVAGLFVDNFAEQPQVGVHRDYHSRNIMILANDELGIIDFQDAVIGPITYDAVSLMRDCYLRMPDKGVDDVLKAWHEEYYSSYEWSRFKRWFDLTGIQRHVKASGIFARLNHRDGKSMYLGDIPRTLGYIVDVGKHYVELEDFITFIECKVVPTWKNLSEY